MLKFNPLTGNLDDVGTPYDPSTDTLHVLKAGDTMDGSLVVNNSGTAVSRALSIKKNDGGDAFFINTFGDIFTGTIRSFANLNYNLGRHDNYYSNVYTQRVNINSTAYLDGATAGMIGVTGVMQNFTVRGGASWSSGVTARIDLGNSSTFIYNIHSGNTGFTTDNVFRIAAQGNTSVFIGSGSGAAMTINDAGAADVLLGTTKGTKLGTDATQKLGFWGATPVVRQTSTPADATDLASAITLINDIKSKLVTIGLIG